MTAERRAPRMTAGRRVRPMDRWWVRALAGAALLATLLSAAITAVELGGSTTDKQVALNFLVNLVAVIGLQTFMGNSGVISFGHAAFVGIGAYVSALLTMDPTMKALPSLIPDAPSLVLDAHMGFLPATLTAVAVVAVIALVVGLVFARMTGAAAAIGTLSLLVIVRTVIGNWSEVTRGPKTFYGVPAETTMWWALGWCVVAIVVARLFRESGVGLRLRATRTDELASAAIGVDIVRARLTAWVLSACLAAVSGALYAHLILAFGPQQFFFELTFLLIVMTMVGGPTVSGAVIGAAAISVLTEVLRRGESGFSLGSIRVHEAFGLTTLVLSALIIAVVKLRPAGLLGRWELDEWLTRAARRRRRGAVPRGQAPSARTPDVP